MNKYSLSALIALIFNLSLQAQNETNFEQALVGSNKMTAVIVVLLVILLGIAFYLFYLERKIKKLEDQIKIK